MPLELSIVPVDEPATAEVAVDWQALPAKSDCRWIDPELRWLVEAYSLDRFERVAELAGLSVDDKTSGVMVRRIVLPTGPAAERAVHIKIERQSQWRDRWRYLLSKLPPVGRLRHEFEMLRRLDRAGIATPRPIAYGASDGQVPASWLVLVEPEGSIALAEYLEEHNSPHPLQRIRLFSELGRSIARLHSAGFRHGRLNSSHMLVVPRADQPELMLSQFDRCTTSRQVSNASRVRELAGLVATLPPLVVTRVEKSALIDAYLRVAGSAVEQATFRARLATELETLLGQEGTWRIRERVAPNSNSLIQLETVQTGQLWIDTKHRSALDRAGLVSFDDVMRTERGTLSRALDDRENWILDLTDPRRAYRAFLKKHHIRTWKTRLRAKLGWGPRESAGRVEADNIARLANAGIPTMQLMAFGEKLHDNGLLESFVLTEELAGYRQLDHFLRSRFPIRDSASRCDPALDELIRSVARIARRFHRIGFNHRDLYCCHFFVRETDAGTFNVRLIDLQRVQGRRRFRRRWIVKDLAQLAYSAPRERIGCRQRVAFLHAYFGARRLSPEQKRLVRDVRFKQRWMERTLGMHP